MKHIKKFEKYFSTWSGQNNISEFPEEIIIIYKIIVKLVKKNLQEIFGDTITNNIRIEENKKDTYSIAFEAYQNYLIIQFDYKDDGLWIKYLNDCSESLAHEINILGKLFNDISINKNNYGWCVDIDTLKTKLNDLDLYYEKNKYNL